MSPHDVADRITLPSARSATETVGRLESLLDQKKIHP